MAMCCSYYVSLQACQTGGGFNVFGLGSMNSTQFGNVSASDWTFTMSYSNAQQGKACYVSYTLATTSGTQFYYISESPENTYVSWHPS